MADPFAHHPGLRDKITPHEASFFRDFTIAKLANILTDHGLQGGWWYSEATREALRQEALARRPAGDLWVFAYGSLMWDPALDFVEVRRAYAHGHARRFILRDIYGGRGTMDAPGLMAALDEGPGCAGLAFRITEPKIDQETEILWRREMITPCYSAAYVPIEIDGVAHAALTFVADHEAELIASDLTRAEQIAYLATGHGFLGSSFDYLRNVVDHLHDMRIPDPDLDALFSEAQAALTGQED